MKQANDYLSIQELKIFDNLILTNLSTLILQLYNLLLNFNYWKFNLTNRNIIQACKTTGSTVLMTYYK